MVAAGILAAALVAPGREDCGGPVPGCGSIRNSGDHPVIVQATDASGAAITYSVKPGERALVTGLTNAVAVDPGKCLTVNGGPFWITTSTISGDPADMIWVPVDDWGARVHLIHGVCDEQVS